MKSFVLFLALFALVCLSKAGTDTIEFSRFSNSPNGNPVCTPGALDEPVTVNLDGSRQVIPSTGGEEVSIVKNGTSFPPLTFDISIWASNTATTPDLIFYDVLVDDCIDSLARTPDFQRLPGLLTNDIIISNFVDADLSGDPHFHPFSEDPKIRAIKYSPHSDRDGVYNIFTNEWFQWNQEWTIYSDISVFAVTPQYVTKEAFVIAHPSMLPEKGGKFKRVNKEKLVPSTVSLEFQTNAAKTSLMVVVKVNGKIVSFTNSTKVFLFGEAYPEYFIALTGSNSAVLSSALVNVKMLWLHQDFSTYTSASAEERNAPKYQWPYFNSNIEVSDIPALRKSHGLLGQTLRPDCPYNPNPWQYCISCFVKGVISDYQIKDNNLFGTDFHFNLFKP